MAAENTVNLSAGEWRVMEALWEAPKTLMELVRELETRAGWAKSTVATMVRRMEDKGLIRGESEGRGKRFFPCVERKAVAAAETESLLSRVYQGSVGLMVNTLLQNTKLSREELDDLYKILERSEEESSC